MVLRFEGQWLLLNFQQQKKYLKCSQNIFVNFTIYVAFSTGKYLSEALLFAEHGEKMLCTKIVLNVRNNFCTQHVLPRFEFGSFMYWTCNLMNNLLSYCGLVDAKTRASDKDLPVSLFITLNNQIGYKIKTEH